MIRKVKLPKLVGETLQDQWYIEFSVFHDQSGRMVRFRKSKGFAELDSVEARRSYGVKQIAAWESKLRNLDYNPFDDNTVFITDEVAYQSGKTKTYATKFDLRHFINQYFASKKKELRRKSYQTYQAKVRIFLNWIDENEHSLIHPKFITQDISEAFCEYLIKKRQISNRSHNAYLQTLYTIWEWFIKKGISLHNPWRVIDKKKFISKSQRPFSKDQSERIVAFLSKSDPWLLFFCEFQYHTLVRPGSEQSQLLVSDIDFDSQELIVRGEISKNKKTQRVAIPDQLMEKISQFKISEYPGYFYIFGRFGPSEKPVGRDHYSKIFRKVLDHLKIGSDWSMYSWKHTMNQRAAMSGIPVKELQIQNRHHSLDQMNEYLKGLTVRDAKNLFNNIPKM